jgi:Family of unknown function (DUF6353)
MKLPKIVIDHSTTILSGLAVAGVVSTVALAIRATPIATAKLSELRAAKVTEENPSLDQKLSVKEVVQTTWRDYLPAGVSGLATVGCILGANQLGLSRNAALLGAYTVVEGAFEQYKDQVVKVIGAKKNQEVVDKVQEKRLEENPPVLKQVVITGGGDQLCFDALTGRYFRGDIEDIRRAENELNARILKGDMYASQNEFYELIGLPTVRIGEILGWNTDVMLEIVFTSALSAEGVPCLAMDYRVFPRVDFNKF